MSTTTKSIDEIIADPECCPLPISVIPNNMGINLCSVDSVTWTRGEDGQLHDLSIKFIPAETAMKIHLGCGEKRLAGFVNVDVRNLETADIQDDIKTLSKFDSDSADLLYASHVLEHIGRREYMDTLKRWFDVIKPGGTIRIAVPDFQAVVEHYTEHKDLSVLRGFLYGGQTYPENYHYCTWDFDTLKSDLEQTGFTDVRRWDWRKTEHSHVDDFSQCYLPHMQKETGKLMSLNVEATKPKKSDSGAPEIQTYWNVPPMFTAIVAEGKFVFSTSTYKLDYDGQDEHEYVEDNPGLRKLLTEQANRGYTIAAIHQYDRMSRQVRAVFIKSEGTKLQLI